MILFAAKERIPSLPVLEGEENGRNAQAKRKDAQIAVPGWKVLRLTTHLCDRPSPSPRPSATMSKKSAARLHKNVRRLRPIHDAHQCGSHLSENVRLTDPTSLSGVSSFDRGNGVVFVVLKTLLNNDFLGAAVGVSQSGTVLITGAAVAIVMYEEENIQLEERDHCGW